MDSFQKKRIISKISTIQKELNDLEKIPNNSKQQRAIIGDLKRKKKRLHSKFNKRITHPSLLKVIWFYKNFCQGTEKIKDINTSFLYKYFDKREVLSCPFTIKCNIIQF